MAKIKKKNQMQYEWVWGQMKYWFIWNNEEMTITTLYDENENFDKTEYFIFIFKSTWTVYILVTAANLIIIIQVCSSILKAKCGLLDY